MGRGRIAPPIKDGDWTSVRQAINRLSTIVLGSEATPTFAGVTLGNTGLHLLDTDESHDLIIKHGSNLTADRILTLTTGDAARTITLQGNPTLSDWFDQSVKVAANPTFGTLGSGVHTITANNPTDNIFLKFINTAPNPDVSVEFTHPSGGGLAIEAPEGNIVFTPETAGKVLLQTTGLFGSNVDGAGDLGAVAANRFGSAWFTRDCSFKTAIAPRLSRGFC